MIITLLVAAAPALVPATTSPSPYSRSRIPSQNCVPEMSAVSRSWSPPVKKTAVARRTAFSSSGVSASRRSVMGAGMTSATPIFSNSLP
jgi:hypothetical protein